MKKYKDKKWLKKQYSDKEQSTYKIAKLCDCRQTTIIRWLKRFNIPVRSRSESRHLAQANHCNLSNEERQWIDGELMGDGCLPSYSKYSAYFRYSSKYLEYIQYVSDTLNSFGIKQSGKICKRYYKEMDCYSYHYASLSYAELLPIRKRWYPEGKKIIPKDLELTPLVLRQEMIGDGSLHHPKRQRPYITLHTEGFPVSDVEWLVNQLNSLDFKSTIQYANNIIGISTKSTKQFLDYIGNCPVNCYQYKFNY